jgi:hypothetical protein
MGGKKKKKWMRSREIGQSYLEASDIRERGESADKCMQ